MLCKGGDCTQATGHDLYHLRTLNYTREDVLSRTCVLLYTSTDPMQETCARLCR